MPVIKQSSIRDLKDRISIYDVVSREVTLRKAGRDFKGLSPFTQEKTPSFFISPDKGFYKCFSSGKAGDIISFIMEMERLNFVEAVETLAQRFGVNLEYEKGSSTLESRSLRQEIFDLHDFVASYYHEAFMAKSEGGSWIRNYWTEGRNFELSVAEDFRIGFAPPDGAELGERVLKKGFSKEALEACGLFYVRRGIRPDSMGYRFRGRLMIPIRDHQGRIVAFTARQLEITPQDDPSREAKYINSPETPIFVKGNLLFNLDRARMEVDEDTPFVMVEGQLDAIRCHSVGLKGAVAPQGTGITEQQLRLIKRYEPRVRCLLDGDRAGREAALRMIPLALQQGVEVSIVPLNEGEDPDDLFAAQGTAALDGLLDREIDAIRFACQSIAPEPSSLSPQAKSKAAREMFAIIQKTDSVAAQHEFVRLVAHLLKIDGHAALTDFDRFKRGMAARTPPTKSGEESEPKQRKGVYSVERDLVTLCVSVPEIGEEIARIVDEEWIDGSTPEGQLLNHVLNEFLHGMWNGPEALNEQLDSAELKSLAVDILFQTPEYENPMRLANEALRRLVAKYADRRMARLKLELARAQTSFNAEISSLMDEQLALQRIKCSPPKLGLPTR